MADKTPDIRQYTEQEVSAILKRAGELQAAMSGGADSGRAGGTSLSQLQQAAAEIGIDPALVQRAAQEIASEESVDPAVRLLGGPWRVDVDRLVAGRVDEESWPCVLDEMRSATGRVGYPKTVGKGFEWLSLQPNPLHITFTPAGQSTRLRVTARFTSWGVLLYLLPVTLSLAIAAMVIEAFGKSAAMTPEMALGLLLGAPAAAMLGGRAVFSRVCARKRRETRNLVSRLEKAIAAPRALAEITPVRRSVIMEQEEEAVMLVQSGN